MPPCAWVGLSMVGSMSGRPSRRHRDRFDVQARTGVSHGTTRDGCSGAGSAVHGLVIEVSSDPGTAQLSVAVPTLDQWMTVSPALSSRDRATTLGQAALERAIVATVQPDPGTPAP